MSSECYYYQYFYSRFMIKRTDVEFRSSQNWKRFMKSQIKLGELIVKKMVLKINQNLDKNYLKNAFQKVHVLLKLQAISLEVSSLMFYGIGVLTKSSKFTEQYLCRSLFFSKVAGLQSIILFKQRLRHRHFSVNFETLQGIFSVDDLR